MPGLDLGMIAMNDSFFSHLEDSTVRELLARTPLQDHRGTVAAHRKLQ